MMRKSRGLSIEKITRESDFAHKVRALLKINPAETNKVILLTSLMFFTSGGAAVGSPGIESLFFSRFGVQYLPVMYIALGILIAVTSLAITAMLGRVNLERVYIQLPLVMGISIVTARILLVFDFRWFYPPLWLGMNLFWTLLNLFCWGLAGITCDTRQAKRLFPIFGAGSIIGLTIGGFLTKPFVSWMGTENLLLVWAATLAVAFVLARIIAQTEVKSRRKSHQPAEPLFERVIEGYRVARESVLIRWMAVAAALFAILYYSVVFPFSKAAAAQFSNLDALTAFLGVFQGLSMGTAFIVSLLFANRIYARFGLMTAILIYPLIYLVGFSVLLIIPVFLVLAGFRFFQLLWSEGVSEGANQAMFNLVQPEKREQTRAFVRGVINPVGVSLVGVILLVSEKLPPVSMYIIGVLAACITSVLVWQARQAYAQSLVDSLKEGGSHLINNEPDTLAVFRHDATAVAAVVSGITDPDLVVRRISAEILADIGAPETVEMLVPALKDVDPIVRISLLQAIAQSGASNAILEVLPALKDPIAEVRVQAIQTLRQLAGFQAGLALQLEPMLDDPSPAVRSRAAANLLLAGPHAEAEELLRDMAINGDLPARIDALKALEDWHSQSAFDIAMIALADHHPSVRKEAAGLLARIDASQCIFPLIMALADPNLPVRQSAAMALGSVGEEALDPLLSALFKPKTEEGALIALEYFPVRRIKASMIDYIEKKKDKALDYFHLWNKSKQTNPITDRIALLVDSLHEKSLDLGIKALKALALIYDRSAINMAIERIDSNDSEQRANAIETIDALSKGKFIRPLMIIWEDSEPEIDDMEDWFLRVLGDDDAWLRACAAQAAMDFSDDQIHARLVEMEKKDPSPLVRNTASRSLNGDMGMESIQTLSEMERILFLRQIPIFSNLTPTDLLQIAAVVQEYFYRKGTVIAKQGEEGDQMFMIVSGEILVSGKIEGEEIEIARRGKGEFVGEMSIISRQPRTATLTAIEDVRVLIINQVDFEEILRTQPETSLAVMRVLTDRLARMTIHDLEHHRSFA